MILSRTSQNKNALIHWQLNKATSEALLKAAWWDDWPEEEICIS